MSGSLPSMQVLYEKRCLWPQRQASEDGSGSALDTLHHIPCRRLSAHKLCSHTYRCCKSSVATRGLCNRASLKNLRAASFSSKIQRLKPHSTSLLCLESWIAKINQSDKSQELPGVLPQHASPQGADSFFSGGLTCQHICTHFCSYDRLQIALNKTYQY